MKVVGLWLIAALVAGCLGGVHPPPAPPRDTRVELHVWNYQLPSGLRIVHVHDPHSDEVQVTTRFQVGAIDDPAERAGMAHLVEHLVYDRVLDGESVVTRLSGVATYFNASTSLDATTFVARAPERQLEALLAIEASRLANPCESIDDATFIREREVVRNELRERERVTRAFAAIAAAIYPEGHPYRRSVAGTEESLASITREDACAFAAAHYAPGNAVLVVSGRLTDDDLAVALAKQVARIPARDFVHQASVEAPTLPRRLTEIQAPVDDDAALVAWPLPTDPEQRAKVRALLASAITLIDDEIHGDVSMIELGDARAPIIGLLLSSRGGSAKYADLAGGARTGLRALPDFLDQKDSADLRRVTFGRTQHAALYRLYAELDDRSERDARLASLAMQHPLSPKVMQEELNAIRQLTPAEASAFARQYLDYDHAAVIGIRPAEAKPIRRPTNIAPVIEQRDQPHGVASAAEAHQPVPAPGAPTSIAGARIHKLPNGLQVVMLPVSSVPTVDIRIVFRGGTGDERSDRRGTALLAARALSPRARYAEDMLRFATAGGLPGLDVETDHTTFSVAGEESQLDYLLVGLRRWIREGSYDDEIEPFLRRVKRAHARPDARATWVDAWRNAVFGIGHPYVRAGLLREAEVTLDVRDAEQFRRERYTPDNATLVIAGHFDPDLAERWIEYLFGDWTGHAAERPDEPAALQPATLAEIVDASQLEVSITLQARAGDRAAQLVAAEMLAEAAGDVRMKLGASYDVSAELEERRLSRTYNISGLIDEQRADAAIELLAARIAQLRSDPDFAAPTFVRARTRVLARLSSGRDSARRLADRVEEDIANERPVLGDLDTAAGVRALTLDSMQPALTDLDLSRAVIAMRGPKDAMHRAFERLGRRPKVVIPPLPAEDVTDEVTLTTVRPYQDTTAHDLAPALSSESSGFTPWVALAAGMTYTLDSSGSSTSVSGPMVAVEAGHRGRVLTRFGLRLALSSLSKGDETFTAIDLGPLFQTQLSGPFWVSFVAGLHQEDRNVWVKSGLVSGKLGLVIARVQGRWLSLFGEYHLLLGNDSHDSALTFGLGYGR